MTYYQKNGVCFCPAGGTLPEGAEPCNAPFSPLVFLVRRDPLVSRGIFAISEPGELTEPEGTNLLLPPAPGSPDADEIVRKDGACVLNTAFKRCFGVLARYLRAKRDGFRLNVAGLGDVGGTVLLGLILLGPELSRIGVFDFYAPLVSRYCLELNQVLPASPGRVMPEIVPMEEPFDCDAFLFTASKGVPPVGSEAVDVRLAQLAANRELLRPYARQARETGFSGMFCQISDPVDQLSRYVFLESNRDESGAFDWNGLLPEQVRGFGLGVMEARARFAAKERGADFSRGTVYGPHGKELIAANDPGAGYDGALSRQIAGDAATANLRVRELGFKPYLAPGLSSAAISVLAMLRGWEHAAAVPLDGAYFGCHGRLTRLGPRQRREALHPALYERIVEVHRHLKEFPIDG